MNILLVTHIIAHYRKPIFEKLCANRELGLAYTILADERTNLPSLRVVTKSEVAHNSPLSDAWHIRRCIWLPLGLMWQRGVLKEAVEDKYDILIMTGDAKFITVWCALILRRIMGRKSLLWTHGLRTPDSGLKKLVRRAFYSLADGLLLYGQRGKMLVEASGLRNRDLTIVYNSLDYAEQQKIDRNIDSDDIVDTRRNYHIEPGAEVLITSGRITKAKRVDLLIQLMPRLQRSRSVWLIVVGDGPELVNLKVLAKDVGVEDKVVFVGACYDERLLACLMRCANLFVLPGDAGLSVIHGMTYGLPVLTHDDFSTQGPEVEAIEEGVTGSFYKIDNKESLMEGIELWLAKQRLGRESVQLACRRKVAEHYSPEAQLKIINELVSRMMAGRTANQSG